MCLGRKPSQITAIYLLWSWHLFIHISTQFRHVKKCRYRSLQCGTQYIASHNSRMMTPWEDNYERKWVPQPVLSFLRHFELIDGIRAAFFSLIYTLEIKTCCTCYFQVYCALKSDGLLEIHTAHNTDSTWNVIHCAWGTLYADQMSQRFPNNNVHTDPWM